MMHLVGAFIQVFVVLNSIINAYIFIMNGQGGNQLPKSAPFTHVTDHVSIMELIPWWRRVHRGGTS